MGRGSEPASGASSSSSGSESDLEEGQDTMMMRTGGKLAQGQREGDIDDAIPSDSPSASSSDSEADEEDSDSGPAAAAATAAPAAGLAAAAPALPALVGAITLVAPGDAEARNAEVRRRPASRPETRLRIAPTAKELPVVGGIHRGAGWNVRTAPPNE